eukprot:6214593-Pleurochrysis_carterae.AAC.7
MLRISAKKRARELDKETCASCDGCEKRIICVALNCSKYHAMSDGNWCSDTRCTQKRDKDLAYEVSHDDSNQCTRSGLFVNALQYRRPRVVQIGFDGKARVVVLKELIHACRTQLQHINGRDVQNPAVLALQALGMRISCRHSGHGQQTLERNSLVAWTHVCIQFIKGKPVWDILIVHKSDRQGASVRVTYPSAEDSSCTRRQSQKIFCVGKEYTSYLTFRWISFMHQTSPDVCAHYMWIRQHPFSRHTKEVNQTVKRLLHKYNQYQQVATQSRCTNSMILLATGSDQMSTLLRSCILKHRQTQKVMGEIIRNAYSHRDALVGEDRNMSRSDCFDDIAQDMAYWTNVVLAREDLNSGYHTC